jgi:mannose-1-phosphate guanylyltransferase
MNNAHFVILAGGSGQRLWPLSTKACPKHLIPFIGQRSLLQQTIDRILPLTASRKNIWVITNDSQLNKIKDHLDQEINIISEPAARNTAPAILFTCHKIKEVDTNASITILPADHFIPDQQGFLRDISQILDFVENNNKIVTIGIIPTFSATGYGYIQAGASLEKNVYIAEKFHEKPDLEKANQYLKQKNMFWNGGIFVGKLNVFMNEFENNAPRLYSDMNKFFEKGIGYCDLDNISIDYAVMEKSQNIVVVPASFEWSDVGNLNVFLSLQQKHQKCSTEIINIGGQNNLVNASKKIIVFIGLSDLCVVETDDVILISKKDDVENVKKALSQVSKTHENAL